MVIDYCFCSRPTNMYLPRFFASPKHATSIKPKRVPMQAATVESYGSSDFVHRMEQAWLISQQPRPVACSSCGEKGVVECKWCCGTGFFVIGDNMLCEVPSRNTTCVICAGKGSVCCSECKGTGFRAKWLDKPHLG